SLHDFAATLFEILNTILGGCAYSLRIVDKLYHPEVGPIKALVSIGNNDEILDRAPQAIQEGELIAGMVWSKRQPIVFHDLYDDSAVRELSADDNFFLNQIKNRYRTAVCLPLLADDVVEGTLFIFRKPHHAFAQGDLDFVAAIAEIIAVTLRML